MGPGLMHGLLIATDDRLNELRAHFGPLAKNLSVSVVNSIQEQLREIEENFSPEALESVRVDVAGAKRFGVHDGQLTRTTRFAKFDTLQAIDVKASSPRGSCRLELTSSDGPYLVLVEVKQAEDVDFYLRLVAPQPSNVIPVTSVNALVVVTASSLSIDALYDVLDELLPLLLLREEAADATGENQQGDGAVSSEEAEVRRRQRRVEREERKRVKLRARDAVLRREILWSRLFTAYKKLRLPVICASVWILLAVVAFSYRDCIPYWDGRKAHDIDKLASSYGPVNWMPAFDKQCYQIVLNETRTTFHYVAGWLEHAGLKNERRREYFEQLRTAADTHVKLLDWYFEPLSYPSSRHLTFKGDRRDVDKVTQLMIDAVDKLITFWNLPSIADADSWDKIREATGPLSFKIADDTPGVRSFWRLWSIKLANECKHVYRFLEQNDFSWPRGGVTLNFIGIKKDEVPYIRIKG